MLTEIEFSVEGWPPAKNEARSIFSEKHSHHPRVFSLLREALRALNGSEWNPREKRDLGLELVVVDAPTHLYPSDATNWLGGVADVLQYSRANVDPSIFGDLAGVSLYFDDGQIEEIRYRKEQGKAASYRVRLWVL